MSDQESQQEPSMEEILASIRRIISEDGDEDTAAAPEAEAAAPEPVVEAVPEPEEPAEPEEVAEAVEPEEDVLELTDEVQDDGTVVNLNTGEAVEDEETPEEFVESLEAEDEEIELEMVDADEEVPVFEEPATEEAEPEPEVVAEAEPEDILVDEAASRLVSDNPAMTSVTSLSALAAAVDTHRRAVDPSIGPRTIEDLVKEVMRPMIKEWLDANLPSLVERMVGREIERLTREAEDISQR
jgi:uncharacterized protein